MAGTSGKLSIQTEVVRKVFTFNSGSGMPEPSTLEACQVMQRGELLSPLLAQIASILKSLANSNTVKSLRHKLQARPAE